MRSRGAIATCLTLALVVSGCADKTDPLSATTPQTTPATTPAKTPPVVPSGKTGPAPAFGVSLGAWGLQHPDPYAQASVPPAVRRAGGTVLRLPVPWYSVQQFPPLGGAPATYTFKDYKVIKAAMKANGIRPLIVILGTPHWALPQPWHCPGTLNCDGAPAPEHMKDLGGFVRQLVKEFPDAVAIEPYNEVNTAINFGPAPVSVTKYVEVLRTVHRAVRAEHSKIAVITSGLVNNIQSYPGDRDAPDFLNRLYKSGAKGNFEGIGLHPYGINGDPAGLDSPFLARINAARAVARANHDAGRPIWITETGYPTGGRQEWSIIVSEAQQSELERCQYELLVGSKDIRVILHNYIYDTKPPGDKATLEDHWGLFRNNLKPKPIVAAMAAAVRHPHHVSTCSAVR